MNVKEFYNSIGGNYQSALAIMMNDVLIARMLTKFINGNSCEEMVSLYEKPGSRRCTCTSTSAGIVIKQLSVFILPKCAAKVLLFFIP